MNINGRTLVEEVKEEDKGQLSITHNFVAFNDLQNISIALLKLVRSYIFSICFYFK